MGDTAIRAENLSKRYYIGARQARYKTLRDTLVESFSAPFRRAAGILRGQGSGAADLRETIWALKNVSLEIKKGESVGIIGRNGAGKSTLLKILSRITEPTEGYAEIHGRVGSLLEVGTGFHPELTGRENIYLNGAILGMTRRDIDRRFDEIVDFAEVERFIDTPVKHYSSGMYLRLAFAVAAHLEPEILLVDEVLAVGDAAFQKKCLGKMDDVTKGGRTVLFVSHNMAAVRSLCDSSFLLQQGEVIYRGGSEATIVQYLSLSEDSKSHTSLNMLSDDKSVMLEGVALEDHWGRAKRSFGVDEDIVVSIRFRVNKPIRGLAVGVTLSAAFGETAFSSYHRDGPALCEKDLFDVGVYSMRCVIPKLLLNELLYYVGITFQIPGIKMLINEGNLLSFKVERTVPKTGEGLRPGVVKPELVWHLTVVS